MLSALSTVLGLILVSVPSMALADFGPDPTVTAVGKSAARAREILNWALTIRDVGFSDGSAIKDAWQIIVRINTVILVVLLIVFAFGLILRAGWAREQKKTVFILLIAFALSYVSFFLTVTIIKGVDQFQARFMRISIKDASGNTVTRSLQAEDLLSVSFSYQEFKGYKNTDPNLQEAVNNNLLLVRMTTWTSYAIAVIIVARIILLWLLVIFSPFIFPCLAFSAIRNVAIVWLREFGRWLFLGPLFAIFLVAVPFIWQKTSIVPKFLPSGITRKSGIPLQTEGYSTDEPKNIYKSGTNIILVPPGVSSGSLQLGDKIEMGNNLSETDTYVRYIVALLMIWAAIILPFLLLRIIMSISFQAGDKIINIINRSSLRNLFPSTTIRTPPPEPKVTPPIGPITLKDVERKDIPYVSGDYPSTKKPEMKERDLIEKMSIPQLVHEAGALPAVNEIMASTEQDKLEKLSHLEQNEDNLRALSQVFDKLAKPDQLPKQDERKRFEAIKSSIYMKSITGEKTASSLNNALTRGINYYLPANIPDQIMQSTVNNFSKNLSYIYKSDPQNERIFQQVYKVPDRNLYEYLKRQAAGLEDVNKAVITLAIQAIDSIKKIAEMPSGRNKQIEIARVALKLSDPQKIVDSPEKQQYSALKKVLNLGQKTGDNNLKQLVQDSETIANISNLQQNPSEENVNRTADSIAETLDKDDDFQNSKAMWKKHYLEAPIPSKLSKDRKKWLESEINKLQEVLRGLVSSEQTKKQDALEQIQNIAPFMLVGGYEIKDVVRYIKAKLQAAKEALKSLSGQAEEEDLVKVGVKKKEIEKQSSSSQALPLEEEGVQPPSV